MKCTSTAYCTIPITFLSQNNNILCNLTIKRSFQSEKIQTKLNQNVYLHAYLLLFK